MLILYQSKIAMYRGIRNPRGLKVRRYEACLIDLNKYLDLFSGAKMTDKIGATDLDN